MNDLDSDIRRDRIIYRTGRIFEKILGKKGTPVSGKLEASSNFGAISSATSSSEEFKAVKNLFE